MHIVSQYFTFFPGTGLQRVRPFIFLLYRARPFDFTSRRKVQKKAQVA
jgi:hypothetical protein